MTTRFSIARDHLLDVRLVEAEHGRAVERHLVHEGEEGRADRVEVGVVVEVLGVDGGDHRDGRRELEERAVGLVGLGHEELALAEPRVGAEAVDAPAHHHGGIEARPRRAPPPPCEVVVVLPWVPAMAMPYLSRISSASISARAMTGMPRWRATCTSTLSRGHGGGVDDDVRALDVGGLVAGEDLGPQALEPLHRVAAPGRRSR